MNKSVLVCSVLFVSTAAFPQAVLGAKLAKPKTPRKIAAAVNPTEQQIIEAGRKALAEYWKLNPQERLKAGQRIQLEKLTVEEKNADLLIKEWPAIGKYVAYPVARHPLHMCLFTVRLGATGGQDGRGEVDCVYTYYRAGRAESDEPFELIRWQDSGSGKWFCHIVNRSWGRLRFDDSRWFFQNIWDIGQMVEQPL